MNQRTRYARRSVRHDEDEEGIDTRPVMLFQMKDAIGFGFAAGVGFLAAQLVGASLAILIYFAMS